MFDEMKTSAIVATYIKGRELGLELTNEDINRLASIAYDEWSALNPDSSEEYSYVEAFVLNKFNLVMHHLKL